MPPHHKHHEPQWMYNAEGDVTRDAAAAILARFASELNEGGNVDLDGTSAAVPDSLRAIVRLERTPHGATALKITLEWSAESAESHARPIEALLKGPLH